MRMLLHCSRPKRGWIKLNTDGAVSATSLFSSIRGVFRNSDGNWFYGFSMAFGKDPVFKVEARVVLEGLLMAWEKVLDR
ncbi:hypothetical protein PVK06_020003 [Gossypium arboreum]|uniref:RNase H type-1 domain-containing protein n=1 Tax=Gossypium arboreum TaxID=29729 RepID=A0ABR0PL87_GOSAR|nr:hypothetical protein PVK06_020003 [Gossypium arboreum]